MKKHPFLLILLVSHIASAQVGYRNTTESKPVIKAYDSSVNFPKIDCQFDPASLAGQQIYFVQINPASKKTGHDEPMFDFLISNKQTPVNSLMSESLQKTAMSGPVVSYSDLSIRFKSDTYDWGKNIQTKMYKPCIEVYGPYSFSIATPDTALENKTFTIVSWEPEMENDDFCGRKVTLRDENGELVTWDIRTRRLPDVGAYVKGYLEKLKQTWVGRNVYFRTHEPIPNEFVNTLDKQTYEYVPGSKWRCTDLTFLFGDRHYAVLNLILQDSAKHEIAIQADERYSGEKLLTLGDIWSEETYVAVKQKEKHERDSLMAVQKARLIQEDKERKAARQQFIKDYGAVYGNLIANGHVKLGMNSDMCEAAWGTPEHKVKSQVGNSEVETWFYYPYASWLRFKNGKLVQIME